MGEILLWKKLRAATMMNYSFNRQKPLNRYIVDFYCKPLNLVIEVDGGYHNETLQIIKDKRQQNTGKYESEFSSIFRTTGKKRYGDGIKKHRNLYS